MKQSVGVIYILTNPSFPQYVKIGYADNVLNRVKELNRSECTPFAFRIFATYEVDARLSDLKLHTMIDKINPSLRSIDTVNGKTRKREFYAMSPESAYAIFEAMAEIHGREDKLTLYEMSEADLEAQETANEIEEAAKEKAAPFRFSMCGIKPGEKIEFFRTAYSEAEATCTVVDDRTISYEGKTYSLSGLATELLKSKWSVAGPSFFKYNGEWLNDIRYRNGY